ncbi:hypothetical protein ACF061_01060 [Streptomyces sp. NPDC015220]|uniref:hypothetical protein n=1 Tax=Streptomyces sp. NPDC015220 TaxID=3364947 RepID=UPI0036FD064F
MKPVLDWFCDLIAVYGAIPVTLGMAVVILAAWLALGVGIDAIRRRQNRHAGDWQADFLEHTTPTPARKETP